MAGRDLDLPADLHPPTYDRVNGRDAARWFGLGRHEGGYRFGYFVGRQRLPGTDRQISVTPSLSGMDYAAMYAACAGHPVVSRHLEHVLHTFPGEPDVDFDSSEHPWFEEVLALAYLRELPRLSARHLRRDFTRKVENLTGRAKGRVLLGDQVRSNFTRLRPDRTVCEFGVFERDTRENRILRSALEVAAASLHRPVAQDKEVKRWIRASRAALSDVPVTRISPADFALARTRGAYARYAAPLRLAQAVLRRFGLDPHGTNPPAGLRRAPPFALCTYELFERFVEVRLRDRHPDVWAGYADRNLAGPDAEPGMFRVRPDFLVTDGEERLVVDAKYKHASTEVTDAKRQDVYKSVAYAVHRGVLERFPEGATRTVLLYPKLTSHPGPPWEEVLVEDRSFEVPVRLATIRCPLLRHRGKAPGATASPD